MVEQWGATDEAQRAGGSYGDTEHDYDALRVSHTMRDGNDTPVPYLEWGVDVVATRLHKPFARGVPGDFARHFLAAEPRGVARDGLRLCFLRTGRL